MLKNKSLWIVTILVFTLILTVVGKQSMDKRSTFNISEEQQKNVATWLVRSYEDIEEIKFLKSYKNISTDSVGVNFRVNNDEDLEGGIAVRDVFEFDDANGIVGLNPISKFDKLKPTQNEPSSEVDLSDVTITYLVEQSD